MTNCICVFARSIETMSRKRQAMFFSCCLILTVIYNTGYSNDVNAPVSLYLRPLLCNCLSFPELILFWTKEMITSIFILSDVVNYNGRGFHFDILYVNVMAFRLICKNSSYFQPDLSLCKMKATFEHRYFGILNLINNNLLKTFNITFALYDPILHTSMRYRVWNFF